MQKSKEKAVANAANAGSIPDELVDENLRTDINWIRRLTLSLDNAKAMLDALIIDDELPYSRRTFLCLVYW